jgi:hypothetical protein
MISRANTDDVPILTSAGRDEGLQIIHIGRCPTTAGFVEVSGHDLDAHRAMVDELQGDALRGVTVVSICRKKLASCDNTISCLLASPARTISCTI